MNEKDFYNTLVEIKTTLDKFQKKSTQLTTLTDIDKQLEVLQIYYDGLKFSADYINSANPLSRDLADQKGLPKEAIEVINDLEDAIRNREAMKAVFLPAAYSAVQQGNGTQAQVDAFLAALSDADKHGLSAYTGTHALRGIENPYLKTALVNHCCKKITEKKLNEKSITFTTEDITALNDTPQDANDHNKKYAALLQKLPFLNGLKDTFKAAWVAFSKPPEFPELSIESLPALKPENNALIAKHASDVHERLIKAKTYLATLEKTIPSIKKFSSTKAAELEKRRETLSNDIENLLGMRQVLEGAKTSTMQTTSEEKTEHAPFNSKTSNSRIAHH